MLRQLRPRFSLFRIYGRKVAALVIVDNDVDGVGVVQIRLDIVDEEAIRNAWQLVDRGASSGRRLR